MGPGVPLITPQQTNKMFHESTTRSRVPQVIPQRMTMTDRNRRSRGVLITHGARVPIITPQLRTPNNVASVIEKKIPAPHWARSPVPHSNMLVTWAVAASRLAKHLDRVPLLISGSTAASRKDLHRSCSRHVTEERVNVKDFLPSQV